ncbi:phosphodiester glycosidase family protein [Calothrix sp. 336/3]
MGFLILPMLFYIGRHFQRPELKNTKKQLFSGITYERIILKQPRPVVIHITFIDLKVPGIKVFVTPPINQESQGTRARTTSDFLQEFKLQLAINANYFYPFHENTPWDYYPRIGDTVNTIGQAISNGKFYGKVNENWFVSCITKNTVKIIKSGNCPNGTLQGVTGTEILVMDGKPRKTDSTHNIQEKPYSRVVIATNKNGDKLWLIAVDGKQPLYSEGLTNPELTNFLIKLGVDKALNLDGGGSTTLVMENNGQPKLLNSPIHTHIPMRERPVANHIGFYFQKK